MSTVVIKSAVDESPLIGIGDDLEREKAGLAAIAKRNTELPSDDLCELAELIVQKIRKDVPSAIKSPPLRSLAVLLDRPNNTQRVAQLLRLEQQNRFASIILTDIGRALKPEMLRRLTAIVSEAA